MKWAQPTDHSSQRTAARPAYLRAVQVCSFVALAYVILISWLDPALPWPVTFASAEPWRLALLNVVPVLILNALFLVATRRVVMACWLTLLALSALYFVNKMKIQELATPLLPDDFHFLKAIGVNYSFFSQYLQDARLQLLVACGVLLITVLLFRETTVRSFKGTPRILAAITSVVLAATLMQGTGPWTSIYNAGRLQFEPWAPLESAARTGLITNMLLFHWELRNDTLPDLSNAKQVLRERDPVWRADANATATTDLPDIIIVQSESLFDPRRLSGVDRDAIPRMREAAARGWSGDLYVPTFGGGTIRTEFEVLTGLPLAAFPRVRYPYLRLTRPEMPSLVRELGRHGYRTLAIHPNGGAFWNRRYAFRAMGFDRFIDVDGFKDAERHGWYISDAALVDKVIAETADDGPPQLIMGISIQNHGPYDSVPLPSHSNRGAKIGALDAEADSALQTYLKMLEASDAELGRLIEWVDARERHTILLFYSDHLPPLSSVFAQLEFRDGRAARDQPVPWLLIDNRSRQARIQHHAAWYLPTLLLERAGITHGAYFAMLDRLAREAEALCECFSADPAVQALAQLQYWGELETFLDTDADTATLN